MRRGERIRPGRWWGLNAQAIGNREKWLPLDAARTRAGVLSAPERAAWRTRRIRTPAAGLGPRFRAQGKGGLRQPDGVPLSSLTGFIIFGTASLKENAMVTRGVEGI